MARLAMITPVTMFATDVANMRSCKDVLSKLMLVHNGIMAGCINTLSKCSASPLMENIAHGTYKELIRHKMRVSITFIHKLMFYVKTIKLLFLPFQKL